MRDKPRTTLHQYSAQAMFHRNGTQDFMDGMLTQEKDQQFLRQQARALDASGLEEKRRRELVEYHNQAVTVKRQRDAKREAKSKEDAHRLSAIDLLLDSETLKTYNVKQLKDQLTLLRMEMDDIPREKDIGNKAHRLEVLLSAVKAYLKEHGPDVEAEA